MKRRNSSKSINKIFEHQNNTLFKNETGQVKHLIKLPRLKKLFSFFKKVTSILIRHKKKSTLLVLVGVIACNLNLLQLLMVTYKKDFLNLIKVQKVRVVCDKKNCLGLYQPLFLQEWTIFDLYFRRNHLKKIMEQNPKIASADLVWESLWSVVLYISTPTPLFILKDIVSEQTQILSTTGKFLENDQNVLTNSSLPIVECDVGFLSKKITERDQSFLALDQIIKVPPKNILTLNQTLNNSFFEPKKYNNYQKVGDLPRWRLLLQHKLLEQIIQLVLVFRVLGNDGLKKISIDNFLQVRLNYYDAKKQQIVVVDLGDEHLVYKLLHLNYILEFSGLQKIKMINLKKNNKAFVKFEKNQ